MSENLIDRMSPSQRGLVQLGAAVVKERKARQYHAEIEDRLAGLPVISNAAVRDAVAAAIRSVQNRQDRAA